MEVNWAGVAAQLLNGVIIGMIYALMGLGLSIIVGLLGISNFVHGTLFAFGAYVLLSVIWATGNFWLGLVLAPLAVLILSVAVEMGFLRRLYVLGHDYVLLFTFALALIFQEATIIIWGPIGFSVLPPEILGGGVNLVVLSYPKYSLFLLVVAALSIVGVWLFLERTRYGAIMRAGLEDPEMVSALGINVKRVFTFGYGLGAYLGALAGALNAPIRGLTPFLGIEILPIAFVVVTLGGLGNLLGAIAAGLIIGVVQSMVTMLWAQGSSIAIFAVMALILLLRPQGLFGVR